MGDESNCRSSYVWPEICLNPPIAALGNTRKTLYFERVSTCSAKTCVTEKIYLDTFKTLLLGWSCSQSAVRLLWFLSHSQSHSELDYLPAYYQACKDASPVHSGVDLLGYSISIAPVTVIAGVSVTITERYRPQIWGAWILFIAGIVILATVQADSPIGQPIAATCLLGIASGILGCTCLLLIIASRR